MGGNKDSSAAKTYDYYGTVAGLICWGPVDGIHFIFVDGKEIFAAGTGGLPASGDSTNLVPIDSSWSLKTGYIRIYWGTQTQTANPELNPTPTSPLHPAYRGFCYIVFHGFLFGRERTMAPNIEVVVWRKPRPPSFLEPVDMEDGQVNPVPVMAELVTSLMGLEQEESILESQSWIAAAQWVWGDPDRRARMAVSTLITDTGDIRSRLAALMELTETALAWNEDGLLELRLLQLGEVPAGIPTLDARYCTGRPVVHGGGWADVPTGVFARYVDRDRRWKEASQKIDNILARHLRGEPNRQQLDLRWITRATQAAAVATRYLVRAARPGSTIDVQVRSSMAERLLVGTKALVDVDPEPGGAGLGQSCIVIERRDPREGSVSLILQADTLAEALPYIPAWVPAEETGRTCQPILYATVIPLTVDGWGLEAAVSVLATRPQPDVSGMTLFYAPASAPTTFTKLGQQTGFAVRITLTTSTVINSSPPDVPPITGIDPSAELLKVNLTDGADNPDAALLENTPPDSGIAAQDEFLLVLLQLDASGRVVIDSSGRPVMEMISLYDRGQLTPTEFTFSALRGRRGTSASSWPTGTVGWIVPLINLAPWTHPRISSLVRGTEEGRIQMVAYTAYVENDTAPIPERGFYLPPIFEVTPKITWLLPTANPALASSGGQIDVDILVTDPNQDLVRVTATSRKDTGTVVEQGFDEFPQTGSWRVTKKLDLVGGAGMHTLQVIAIDGKGHRSVSIRMVEVPAGGGAVGTVPTFSPEGGDFYDYVGVTITAAPGHNSISYLITSPRSTVPNVPFACAQASSFVVMIRSTCYLWAASGNACHATSPVVFASFVKRQPLP